MKKYVSISSLLILFCLLFISSCSKSTEPEIIRGSYTPLNVGDMRQIISLQDSSSLLMEVIGTTKRAGGREVFVCIQNMELMKVTLIIIL